MNKRRFIFNFLLYKAWFDKGLGITSYFKYLLAFVGIFQLVDAKMGIIILFLYLVSCFILGYLWYKHKLIDVENEIGNLYNPFQREVRRKLSARKI
jgi:hypothetical protein